MTEQQFDAVIVGAGFAGIGAAIQLKRLGYDNFVILEREDDLGGAWHVNRYPGLAVDVPSTTYSYPFEPNPCWSRLFAPGQEVKQYAADVAAKYDLYPRMRFNANVEGARWDEEASVWRVALAEGQGLTARVLITATGILSQPFTPDIPGLTSFLGRIIHSTAWDDTYDFAGRKVAVIGTGATAVQLIPELAKSAGDLTVYQRTATYVVPKADIAIPLWLRRVFVRVPVFQRGLRWLTDTLLELMMVTALLRYRQFRRLIVAAADLSKILRFVSIRDKELRRRLTPDYEFGCKRGTASNSYYRAFTKPHVHLHTAGIERIEPDGVVGRDGVKTPIDTLVLATGFDLWEANFPAIEVIGRDGRNLGKWWRDNGFQAYQGITIPFFPNYLSMSSPYSFSGLSAFYAIDYQMRHMDRLLGEVKRRKASTFEVTEKANAQFMDRIPKLLEDSVFARGACSNARSYYFNQRGEAALLRPTSTRNAIEEQARFPLSDYEIA